jgi:hypothetical protein
MFNYTAAAVAAVVATVMAMMPTAIAAAAISHTTAIATASAIAAMAAVTGHGLALTAHQGDADHREENRDAKDQCTIHPGSSNFSSLA